MNTGRLVRGGKSMQLHWEQAEVSDDRCEWTIVLSSLLYRSSGRAVTFISQDRASSVGVVAKSDVKS